MARAALVFCAAAGAAGCSTSARIVGLSQGTVDPNSPVAKDVLYASRHPGPYPKFTDIPNIPTDIRPPAAWRSAVLDIEHRKAVLNAEVAALPAVSADTEAYAASTRSRAAASPSEVPPADAGQQTESYAKALRDRATPPPPPR